MATRYSNGQMSDPGNPQTLEGQPQSAEPVAQSHPKGAVRVKYNTEDGSTTVEQSHQTGGVVTPSADKAFARGPAGNMISLGSASPTDTVYVPGYGDSVASVFEEMGLIARDGNGYKVVVETQPQPITQQQQDKPKTEDQPAGDVTNVPGTSQDVDTFQADLAKRSPVGFEGLMTSLVKTGEMPSTLVQDLARQSGQEPAEFTANVQRMTDQYVAAGRAALSNVGVTAPEAFESWARANQPDAFDNAVRELVGQKSVARMQDLGRQFVAQNNTRLASLIQSHGVDTKVENGEVWVSRASLGLPPTPKKGDFGGDQWSTLRQMISEGHISIA
jgi:hypothetical protein